MQTISGQHIPDWSENDIVNLSEWIFDDSVRGYLFHDHGFTVGFVFAHNLQDAIDELADSGRIDSFEVDENDRDEYSDDSGISFLGNFCKPYDVEALTVVEFPPLPMTEALFCQLFELAMEDKPAER